MNKKRIFLIIGFAIITLIGVLFFVNQKSHFNYKGVTFYIENKSGKILYKTSLPVTYTDKETGLVTSGNYDFYFKNDPRLENIDFSGDIKIKEKMILNITREFKECNEGDILALKNLLELYTLIGTKVVKNETIGCDDLYGKYSWVNIRKRNNTEIIEWGAAGGCYNINIKNCEISEGVERFLLETLIKLKEKQKEEN